MPPAPRTFYVPTTHHGIVCGLCTTATGIEIRHADIDDVATCAKLRFEAMGLHTGPIPAWLV